MEQHAKETEQNGAVFMIDLPIAWESGAKQNRKEAEWKRSKTVQKTEQNGTQRPPPTTQAKGWA